MEFLKEILGDELYSQLETAINAYNGNEANKDKKVKLANLESGEYVGKGKYDALQALFDGQKTELDTANGLISELKKGTKGNEELQGKITTYETQVADLQKELQETKIKAAVKVGLLSEKCKDVDYVTFKLMESLKDKGESLELDENDNIKNWSDKVSGLKTQLPNQFESASGGKDGFQVLGDNKLKQGDGDNLTVTKEQFLKMGYNDRLKLKQENEQLYKQLAKN